MFFNYCRVAWRNISRQKLFSFINIFGLALSMSIGLIVLVRLKDELGTDRFHPNGNRIYRVISQVTNKQHNTFRLASSPIPVATELQKNNAFIEAATTLYPAWNGKADANKKQINVSTVFIEPSFFKVFGFKTLSGKNNDLQAPNTAVITKDLANRFFGSTNPVGQTIQMGKLGTFLVVDVMQPAPGRSHIEYDAYLSFSSITLLQKNNILSWQAGDWNPTYGYTYVLLSEGTSEKKLASALDRIASSINKSQAADAGTLSFDTQSLLSISPGEELQFSIGNVATTGKVTAEIAIALIILLSACFNYTNLSIARALKRAKEVGIRKVNGASRHSIFLQFLVESIIISLLSLVLSGIIFSFLKEYAPFSREMIPPNIKVDGQLILWLALFSLGTGTVAGTIPALILSAFNPVQVLKNLANVKLFGRNGFRKALTVIQFSLSLVIIIFMMTASRQFKYMATADYGFNRNNILSVPLQGADYSLLKTEIAKVGGVQRVAGLSDYPGWSASGTIMMKPLPAADGIKMGFFDVDENYLPNLQLQLLAGKNFTGATTDDERDV
ncbi:MAG TPA: ABC transporter permease, partial [Chitinophagaceae bacterium]|nr:ABC transporter permease [Chitinophagaceae bacterium]